MSFLLDKKQEHEGLSEASVRAGRFADAAFHAAKAAEFALALARETTGSIARRYAEDADGWIELAERMRNRPDAPAGAPHPGGSAKREPTAADAADTPGAEEDWLVARKPSVTFDRIAGMAAAKQLLFDMIVYPMKSPDKARALGLKPGGGILLYGPPGNGKTLLGKAIASELDAPFYYASGAQIRSKWHGESEQRLRRLMQAARANPLAVLFFDEVEGLLPRRGGQSVVDNRIVTQFLAEIGGFEESENVLLLLGATNCPWDIDDAVFRTGRFDEKIFIGLPDAEARQGILAMHLDKVPTDPAVDRAAWVARLDGYTGSDIVAIVNAAKRTCLSRSVREGAAPVVLDTDMQQAKSNIPSSVTPALMRRYETFRDQRF